MTSMEISAITWIYAVDEPYHRPNPAYDLAIKKFLRMGYIVANETSRSGFRTTAAGDEYVIQLQAIPT